MNKFATEIRIGMILLMITGGAAAPVFAVPPASALAAPPETVPASPPEAAALSEAPSASPAQASSTPVPEPWGFAGITLGMSMKAVEAQLETSPYFVYDSRQLSWLPFSPLISAKGRGLLTSGAFHFVDDQLYSIHLEINPVRMDYWTLMRQFRQKYGDYALFEPLRVVWKGQNCSLSLEKPLSVTYLDAQLHQAFVNQSRVEQSKAQENRETFLNQF